MAIRIGATRQQLADKYGDLGVFFGLATGDPGTTVAPANEASGGAYARVATHWSSSGGGVETGKSCTISANAGAYTFAIFCSGFSGPNMVDNCPIVTTTLSKAGQIVLTPTYTQS
jgi:hypothetical protein